MSEVNLKSTEVTVYPATRRINEQYSAKLMSESAYTNVVKLLSPNGAGTFITSYDGTYLEFCIDGYYFKINPLAATFGENNVGVLWAKLSKEVVGATDSNLMFKLNEIKGDELSNNQLMFKGIVFEIVDTTEVRGDGWINLGTRTKIGTSNIQFLPNSLIMIEYLRKPYVVSEDEPKDSKNIFWIDNSNDKEILKYYDGSTWTPIGAVFK